MVSSYRHKSCQLIVAEPNRSADWPHNQLMLLLIGLWVAVIAAGFAMIGAWMVLPFAGIEILVLGSVLYYVCWKQHHRHVLRIGTDSFTVEKGVYYPKRTWEFPRSAMVSVTDRGHDWDPLSVRICHAQDEVSIGDFLNRDDSRELVARMREQGLRLEFGGR